MTPEEAHKLVAEAFQRQEADARKKQVVAFEAWRTEYQRGYPPGYRFADARPAGTPSVPSGGGAPRDLLPQRENEAKDGAWRRRIRKN